MKVHWTDTADQHLDSIFEFISKDSPVYAKQTVDRITKRSQQISQFPLSGRRVPEYDMDQIREVMEGSYRIIYEIYTTQKIVLVFKVKRRTSSTY